MLRFGCPPRGKIEGFFYAGMTELADVQDLGSCGEIRVGSTPTTRTIYPYHVAAKRVLRPYFYAVNRRCWMRGRKVKIHIIGGSGSGKSFLAEELSKEYGIPHYDLDDLQWDQQAAEYGTKRDPQERQRLLEHILKQPDWIVEGVYYAWCQQCFADADRIYLLCVPRYQYRYRIIRRFVRRKLGIEKGKKETLKSAVNLLKWADRYQKENMVEIRTMLAQYSDKIIENGYR